MGSDADKQSAFVAESDSDWWGRIARESISQGRDRPCSWEIQYDDGEDGCMPSGWYAQALAANGASIDWPIRHEYGPFDSESEALEHTASVDAVYATLPAIDTV